MISGDVFLWGAAISLAAALLIFAIETFRPTSLEALAYWLFFGSALSVSLASAIFLAFLLNGRFDIAYVYGYTSLDLPLHLKVTSFWAGPEGSFLFWALAGAWGGALLWKTAGTLKTPAMFFWCLTQGFLLTVLLISSPFDPLPAAMFPQTPPDGAGLNPILQDPWMVIHPPVMFFGFVAFTAPACLAAAALLTQKYSSWTGPALAWASAGWFFLGLGLVLGGVWAYQTLGWGGYWGWDPVENSSLVPWITGTVLLHGLIIERRRGTGLRINLVYAPLTYILVLYSTFLTRSGILGDFSVHSFTDLGIAATLGRLVFLLLLIFFGLLVFRVIQDMRGAGNLSAPPIVDGLTGKEANHYANVWVLSAIAFLVLLGTSTPILTGLIAPYSPAVDGPSSVNVSFYNQYTAPFALLMLALLALCPVMAWTTRKDNQPQESSTSVNTLVWILGFFLAGLVFPVVLLGLARGIAVAISLAGLIGAVVNSKALYQLAGRGGILQGGHFVAHVGFCLMFVGIGASGLGRPHEVTTLVAGAPPVKIQGWGVALQGITQNVRGELIANLSLESPGARKSSSSLTATPMPNGGFVLKPHIIRGFFQDVYFAPKNISASNSASPDVVLETPPEGWETLSPALIAGERGMRSDPAKTTDGRFAVSVVGMAVEDRAVALEVSEDGGPTMRVMVVRGTAVQAGNLAVYFENFGGMAEADDGTRVEVTLRVSTDLGLFADQPQPDGPGSMVLEVSWHPLMSVLWMGCFIMFIGSILSVRRRFHDISAG